MPHKFKVGDIVTLKPSDGVADKLVSIPSCPTNAPRHSRSSAPGLIDNSPGGFFLQ